MKFAARRVVAPFSHTAGFSCHEISCLSPKELLIQSKCWEKIWVSEIMAFAFLQNTKVVAVSAVGTLAGLTLMLK